MSWWVSLNDENKEPLTVSSFIEGGTITIDGSREADLNITWNYAPHFYNCLDAEKGIRWLHEKTGQETIIARARAVDELGTGRVDNYWEPTRGNAGYALNILLVWAAMYPAGVWEVC